MFMRNSFQLLSLLLASLLALPAVAMVAMDEHEMAGVLGQGIAIALDDFSFRMAPTSFIEITGTTPSASAAAAGWQRGDVRFYGLSITGGGAAGTDFFNNGCSAPDGFCPIGTTSIANFAPVGNPYVFRAFQNPGFDFQGNLLQGANAPTALELIGPTNSDTWRWSFWGEIEVGRGTPGASFLQSQTMIRGKASVLDDRGAPIRRATELRMFQVENAADPTFGLAYNSALSGDFRFSVSQNSGSPNLLHAVPDFNDLEGVHFKNVSAFLPLGRLHSQAITLNSTPANDGNFRIEVTQIPNVPNVYNDFYCGNSVGCATNVESVDFFGNSTVAISSPNQETHGFVRWGDFSSIPGPTSTANGIFFRDSVGNVTNIGVARLEGMLVQSLTLTTLGVGP